MPTKVIADTTGGLSLRDSELLEDNQFEVLKNWYYDQDKRLSTRRGIEQYFDDVPDATVTIDACDATTGWSVSGDGALLTTGTAIRGTNSLAFDIDVSASGNDDATLVKSTISADISTAKGFLGFWFYVPAAFNTDLTSVTVRLGTDSSNYYEWTLSTLTEDANNYLKLNYADATTTGTLNDASITYFRLFVAYDNAYTDKNNLLVDSIVSYSATSTKPINGYFFTYDTANENKITIAVAGTNMFHWNETGWDVIDTGLTEFDTAEGKTSQRTRWGFFAYNGSGTLEVGMGNGIDDYRKWDGTVITTFGAQPKCKYFVVQFDQIFATGDPSAPLTIYYTNAGPTNVDTIDTNDIDAGTEFDGDVTGIFNLGEILMIGKERSIYYFDPVDPTLLPIDTRSGLFGNRSVRNVGNAILYQTDVGITNLMQKREQIGAQAMVTESYTADLEERFAQVKNNQRSATCAGFADFFHNYYVSFDTSNDNKPETTFVYSALVAKGGTGWSEYTYPALYQYGFYIDSNNAEIPLIASANAGQFYRIEFGFDDLGTPIPYEFKTKEFNMGDPGTWKDWKAVDLFGLKNKGSEFTLEVIVEGETVYTATLDDTFLIDETTAVSAIGVDPVGQAPIGGGGEESSTSEIDLFRYRIRLGGSLFSAGRTIQIVGRGEDNPTVMTLDRFQIAYDNNTFDIIPTANFA